MKRLKIYLFRYMVVILRRLDHPDYTNFLPYKLNIYYTHTPFLISSIKLFIATCACHHLSYEFEPFPWRGVLDTTLCDKVCYRATGWWFSIGTHVSSTNKNDHHDIAELSLKVAVNIIKQTNQ